MAKVKRTPPTSIRLSPDSLTHIESLQRATGWSASKVMDHLVLLGKATQTENQMGVKLMRNLMRIAADSHAKIVDADKKATAARSAVRQAAAAVKGAK